MLTTSQRTAQGAAEEPSKQVNKTNKKQQSSIAAVAATTLGNEHDKNGQETPKKDSNATTTTRSGTATSANGPLSNYLDKDTAGKASPIPSHLTMAAIKQLQESNG